jgi:hypothetical protein
VSCYSLSYRIGKLEEIKSPVIDLDSKLFETVTESPRNYTVYVVLTTKAKEHNCVACRYNGIELVNSIPSMNLLPRVGKSWELKRHYILDYWIIVEDLMCFRNSECRMYQWC